MSVVRWCVVPRRRLTAVLAVSASVRHSARVCGTPALHGEVGARHGRHHSGPPRPNPRQLTLPDLSAQVGWFVDWFWFVLVCFGLMP